MTTPKLDEARKALDTLKRFVDSFDAFLSPAPVEEARPVAASQEPRGRPSAVKGKPGPRDRSGPAILAVMKSIGRPMYAHEIVDGVAAVRHEGLPTAREANALRLGMRRLKNKGLLQHDSVTKLWSLQAKIVLDRPVTVTRESDNESH